MRYNFYTETGTEFEYDPKKSAANLHKHGIDFSAAQELWADPDLILIPARTTGEPRSLAVGRIGRKHYSAVITYRDGRIRLISVRRSRREKVALYED